MTDLIDHDTVRKVAAAALARPGIAPGEIEAVQIRPAAHRIDNMTTAALYHVEVTLVDRSRCEVFAKVLHPACASPLMAFIPDDHHEDVMRNLNWLDEPAVYRSALSADLPDDLRMPRLYAIDAHDDRIVLWLEQIDADPTWTTDDYRLAARSLGAMAGRWPEPRVRDELGIGRRDLAYLFFGKLANVDLPVLSSDEHWADPVVDRIAGAQFRADLEALIDRAPMRLAAAEDLPHAMSHGDATPDNLLRTADGIVAVDWSYGSSGPLGADLAQLLAGRFDAGTADPDDAPTIAAVLLDAYLEGLAQEDAHTDQRAVETGWATHLAVRSVISSTILDHRPDLDEDERVELLRRRVAVARVGLELEAQL